MRLAEIYLANEKALLSPEWGKAGKVHDWRNYVPQSVKAQWDELTALGQAAVFAVASNTADQEDWK